VSVRRHRLFAALLLALTGSVWAAEKAADDWDELWEDDWADEPEGLVWTGFLELAGGVRTDGGDDPTTATLGDARARAETEWLGDGYTMSFKADLLHDEALNDTAIDLRELALQFPVGGALDVKAGRQVLTWGTGDLLFLNDLFPKDFESFFAGRDDEYLKAPSTALRITAYHDWVNADLVWTPEFEPDEFLDGERFSFYDPTLGDIGVLDPPLDPDEPDGLDSGELALRLFRRVEATELAVYLYRGYFKQPTAVNESGRPTFAPMNAFGASIRTPLGSGLVNAEVAWYESRDDGNGDDPRIPNSQARWLVGYERELVTNLTGAVQYYGERLADYDALRASYPDPDTLPDEWRSLFTLRLTYRAMRDNLTLGLFTFYSPSDEDYHLRPNISYRISDAWQIAGGANLFGGDQAHTFFGQLEENSNVYVRLRHYY
jgi:hypothetical protein